MFIYKVVVGKSFEGGGVGWGGRFYGVSWEKIEVRNLVRIRKFYFFRYFFMVVR